MADVDRKRDITAKIVDFLQQALRMDASGQFALDLYDVFQALSPIQVEAWHTQTQHLRDILMADCGQGIYREALKVCMP